MIKVMSKFDCAGCSACEQVCAKKAIEFQPDSEGFLYPVVHADLCNDCGLCDKVCPVTVYRTISKEATPLVYAAKHKLDEVLLSSSSGGVFFALANWIISQGGVVFGAFYDGQYRVSHQGAESIGDCEKFKGSKYVQSDLNNTFCTILNLLREGRKVLFTGVPCQVAGLRLFLRKEYENLYTADLICNGVPSPKLFSEFISLIQRKKKLSSINMRWKGTWEKSKSKLFFEDGTEMEDPIWRPLFFKGSVKRPSCYTCEFTHYNRPGDITIADYWGIKNAHPTFYDERGVSLIFINSEKGNCLFEHVRNEMNVIPSNTIMCFQSRLTSSAPLPPNREMFWNEYHNKGFEFIARKYAYYGFYNQSVLRIKRIIKKAIGR